jgi:hypothetical protein
MRIAAILLAAAVPALAFAQQQVVKPPVAVYWISAETAAGMSMPGVPAMAAGMMGGMGRGGGQAGRSLLLQLGSQQAASGAPKAEHDIPPGMNMGPMLPLVTPQREPSVRERERPEGMERPRGRMLLYWGCGEAVRPGQPVVIDFAGVAEGKSPPNLVSRAVSRPTGPSFGRSRTYGDWPNPEQPKAVPGDASLRGEHVVRGNYSPEIRFALEKDFLDRVELAASGNSVRWNAITGATGYFATLYGAQSENEIVFWSSSEVQEMGSALMDYLPPAEVARLIREKVVMPAATLECTVPTEVAAKAGTPLFNFIAYGDEVNYVQPPRPQDPRVAWEQKWAAKVRFKSTAALMLTGERAGRAENRRATGTAPSTPQGQAQTQPAQAPQPAPDPVKDGIREGVNVLKGIFGR